MAFQDYRRGSGWGAAGAWLMLAGVLLFGCSSAPRENARLQRMRLYAKYHHELDPGQRREFLASKLESAREDERRLKEYAAANRARKAASKPGGEDVQAMERKWREAEEFTSDAQEFISSRRGCPATPEDNDRKAQLSKRCAELVKNLEEMEARIRQVPCSPSERDMLLARNTQCLARLRTALHLLTRE